MYKQEKFTVTLFFLSLIILTAGLAGFFLFNSSTSPVKSEVVFSCPDGGIVKGSIFLPHTASVRQVGGVVIAHGVASTRDLMEPMAEALAEKGVVVLTYDTPFTSDEKNDAVIRSAIKYLRSFKGVDPGRIALIGHSMGGRTAANVASTEKAKAVISLGMSVFASSVSPSNLLMIIGLYDELHTPFEMIDALKTNSDGFSEPGRVWGDFSKENARMLFISPAADHASEIFDPKIIGVIQEWISRALGIASDELNIANIKAPAGIWKIQFVFFIYAGAFGFFLSFLFFFKKIFLQRKIFLRILPSAIFFFFLLSSLTGKKVAVIDALPGGVFLFLCMATVIFNFLVQSAPPDAKKESLDEIFGRKTKRTLLYFLVVYFSFQAVIIFSAMRHFIVWPSYLKDLPLFIWQQMTLGGYHFLGVEERFFSPFRIEGIVVSLIILGLEAAFPGYILGVLCRTGRALLKSGYRKKKTSFLHIIALTVLFAAAVSAWLPWIKSGQLDWILLYSLLKLCIKLLILPLILIYAVISTDVFKRIDSRLKEGA
ncbi:MAG: alpha/beta fold hydrolase [Firmicutes bacterium]|nr:alpha/beta fold hydrolase [Bacillota bacterium]